MKSIQAEDKGTYICAIKQPRGSEPSIEKSQSINVIVVGKRYLNLDVLRGSVPKNGPIDFASKNHFSLNSADGKGLIPKY